VVECGSVLANTALNRAHSKVRFDFPLLLFEVLRHALPCDPFEQWLFVDTLDVLRGVGGRGCLKLQCLVREMAEASDLRAHRALDDVVALRHVVASATHVSGVNMSTLLLSFAQELDLPSSLAQTSVLLEEKMLPLLAFHGCG